MTISHAGVRASLASAMITILLLLCMPNLNMVDSKEKKEWARSLRRQGRRNLKKLTPWKM